MFEQPGPVLKSASAYAVQETGRSLIRLCPNYDGWSKQSFTLVCWSRSAPLPSPSPSMFLIYLRCTHNLNAWNRLANRKLPLYSSNDRKPSLSPSTNSRNSYDKITHNFMLVELCGLKTYNRDLERQYSNTFCFPNDKKKKTNCKSREERRESTKFVKRENSSRLSVLHQWQSQQDQLFIINKKTQK